MNITVMKIDDYDDVYNLWISTPGMGLNNLGDSLIGIDKYLRRNPNTCFVAREEGKLIGVIMSGHDGRRGFIHHTAIDLKYRNKWIGKKLLEEAITSLRLEGINKIAFVVFKNNIIGNEFWEKLGFEERTDLIYRNKVITDKDMKKMNI